MSTQTSKRGLDFGLIGLVTVFAGLVVLLIVYLVRRQKEKNKLKAPEQTEITEATTKPTQAEQKMIFNQIVEAAKTYGFTDEQAKTIAGVSAHETGRWSSHLALVDNNIFGMKNGGAGKGIQNGVDKGYATYASWEDSLQDYVELLKARNYPFEEKLTAEQHLQWMKSKKYFEDSLQNYKNGVLSLSNELSA